MKLIQIINEYVALKQSLGNKYRTYGGRLRFYCRSIGNNIDIEDVTSEQVNKFFSRANKVTRSWYEDYKALSGFYKYAISRGYIKSSPLPKTKPKLTQHFVPYIYTYDQIRQLLKATSVYRKPTFDEVVEAHTLYSIILLVYGAGLRLSEAVNLNLVDVNLMEAILTIRNTKFNKSRLVPIGTQLNQEMVQYLIRRSQAKHSQEENSPFFIGRNSLRISMHATEELFRRLCVYVGIQRNGGVGIQPRLHDLRHTFAVHRLIEWYKEGKDVNKLLFHLSTYMGHIDLSSTQIYLTMTPELLREANRRFEEYALKGVNYEQ